MPFRFYWVLFPFALRLVRFLAPFALVLAMAVWRRLRARLSFPRPAPDERPTRLPVNHSASSAPDDDGAHGAIHDGPRGPARDAGSGHPGAQGQEEPR